VGLSPFAMPPPTTRRVTVRCAALGVAAITVPAPYAALLTTSGATRIQTVLLRPALMMTGLPNVIAVSGHAIIGFSN
jgi:hypothetical protein